MISRAEADRRLGILANAPVEEEALFDYWGEYFKQMGGEDAEFTDEVMEKFKGYYYEAKSSANQGVFDLSMEEGDDSLVLEPIEIEFEEQEGVNWRVAAGEYIKKELAGRVFDMPDGYRVAIPKGRNSRDRMVKGLRSQKKYECVNGLERVFEVARLVQKNKPQHKEHESKRKERLVDRANSYNVFGYPLQINGHLCYGWFGAFNFDKDAPKDVVFYEFGVKEEDGFSGMAVGHDENHEVRPQLNPSSSEVTLGDLKRVVNGNNEGSETNFSAEWEYELVGIRMRAEEEGVFMKAPNGEPSHLSERLWCVVGGIMSYARRRIEQYECGALWKVIKFLFWFTVIVWGSIVLFMFGGLQGWFVCG